MEVCICACAGLTDKPDNVEGGVGEDRCVGLI